MYFDVTMPITLFAVTALAMFLNKRAEVKLKKTFEEKQLCASEAVLFVVLIGALVSIVIFVPQMAIMAIFLFSYCTLLLKLHYFFSNTHKRKVQLFCSLFGIAGLAAGTFAGLHMFANGFMFCEAVAAYGFAAFAFFAVVYEQKMTEKKERWYLGVLPSALFVLLYSLYVHTPLWFPYLLDFSGVIFAVLITLYLGSLFSWKNVFIFAGLLTVMDIVLVLFTRVMVTAANQVAGLGLPVLITLPAVPLILTERGLQYMSLGLGDFFFAGILATKTLKKFGGRIAVVSTVTMCLSFAIFEAFLMNSQWGAFPGTLMIICGWLPIVAWKLLTDRKTKDRVEEAETKIGC